jgi:DNA helicase HerA-like ATPase
VGAVNISTVRGYWVTLVYNPGKESVKVGDNIVILDRADKRGVLALVIEILVPVPSSSRELEVTEPLVHAYVKKAVEGLRLAVARIMMEVELVDGELVLERWRGYAPSRNAEFLRASPSDVVRALRERRLGARGRRGEGAAGGLFKHPVAVGSDAEGDLFEASAYDLQGLNLIVGTKGVGKSHLAKAMLLGLAGHGTGCLVFDVNDEYSRLDLGRDGRPKPELEGLFVKLKLREALSLPWGLSLLRGRLARTLSQLNEGKILVVNLGGLARQTRRAAARVLLSNLLSLLESRKLEPVFLFAEEAHLYIDRADIEDLVTSMRRLGLWQFYVTSAPTSLPELLVRQADNLFCFHLSLPDDVKHVAPASRLEPDALQRLVAALPPRHFLAVGRATEGYPVILRNRELDVQAAGETRYRFLEP